MPTIVIEIDAPVAIPELEPFDEEELDDIFARLAEGEGETTTP